VRERSGSVTSGEVIGKIVICEEVLFIGIYSKTLFIESIVVSNLNHPSINLQLNPV
jgi:hypothetical protein